MRRRSSLLAGMLFLSACSADVISDSSSVPTTISTTTSTTLGTTTTTTSLPTTTSTASTTTTLLDGKWASEPLVVSESWAGALGWWDGTEWIGVDLDTELPVEGGEDYQIVLLGTDGVVQGGPWGRIGCGVVSGPFPAVPLNGSLQTSIDDGTGGERLIDGVAISAPWSIYPRQVSEGEVHPDLEVAAVDLLATRGYLTETPKLVQALEVDFDGDGAIETFVVADEPDPDNDGSDSYSIVFAVSPAWTIPVVIAESVTPPGEDGYPASFRVSAIADLSGDGQMEVVLSGSAFESGWVSVFEFEGGAFLERLAAGCGV